MKKILALLFLSACVDSDGRKFVEAKIGAGGVVLSQTEQWLSFIATPSTGRFQYAIGDGVFTTAPTCIYSSSDTNVYPITIQNWSPTTKDSLDIQALFNNQPIDSLTINILCTGF